MKKLLAVFFCFMLCANGCKEPVDDTNPQQDPQDFSTTFTNARSLGEIQLAELDEASGLAHSRSNPSYLWSHNDSGGDPSLFLMNDSGDEIGIFEFDGASNVDWEDMAIGPGPTAAQNYLYTADIGDNRAVRPNYTIYRVPEPDLSVTNIPSNSILMDVEAINFIYDDGNSRDAEALMVDPSTADIYIVSKREASVILYRLPFPQNLTQLDTADRLRVLPYTMITAADISADGNEVLIKNYLNVYHWAKTGTESISELLSTEPSRLQYTVEPQGEAIAWHTDGTRYFTLSERGRNNSPVVLFDYRRN